MGERDTSPRSKMKRGLEENEPMSKHLGISELEVTDHEFTPRILLVDDDPTLLEALRLKVEADGSVCATATDGLEALKVLRQKLVDLVIVDLRMPNMSGYELIPKIRRKYPRVGVIVCSAEPEDDFRRLNLPVDAYLRKGAYSSKRLMTAIEQVMQRLRSLPASASSK
jgi:CheY-like chemotaxis protein